MSSNKSSATNNGSPKIAAIIPAYNEEKRIAEVLKAIKNVPLIDETIVVDDGSTDKTESVAKNQNVTVLRSEKNGGKGAALKFGIS